VAANVLSRALDLTALTLGIHALYAQAMLSTSQTFAPFIHEVKPHAGQVWTAAEMARLVAGSKLMREEAAGERGHRAGKLIQDRYSLRCLPQFVGPIVEGLGVAARQIETEANSANDNPLIDPETGEIYHTGNFLAQYTGVALDSARFLMGLLAKHVDAQIALLMTPEFSFGLNASLVGNTAAKINVGLKALQVNANQMMTLIVLRPIRRRSLSDACRAVQPEHQQPGDERRDPGARPAGRPRALPGSGAAVHAAGHLRCVVGSEKRAARQSASKCQRGGDRSSASTTAFDSLRWRCC
jgi:hypothetical protein